MTTLERRQALRDHLTQANAPVTGRALACLFSVSRQVIVQDIALLRASGADVISTAEGYWIRAESVSVSRVFACQHSGMDALREELFIMVDNGGTVKDICVDHPVYGELRGMLMLSSRRAVLEFVANPDWQEASPLSSLTGGVHLHTVEARDVAELDAIQGALEEAGYLVR